MKRAPRSRQRHDLYAKYHDYDSEISDLLGECGIKAVECAPPDAAGVREGPVHGRILHNHASTGIKIEPILRIRLEQISWGGELDVESDGKSGRTARSKPFQQDMRCFHQTLRVLL